jgi:hypothetical protein
MEINPVLLLQVNANIGVSSVVEKDVIRPLKIANRQ